MTDAIGDAFLIELDLLGDRLRKSIDGVSAGQLDRVLAPDTNSMVVLVAHTCGSLTDWLHTAAGRTVVRDRESEFRTAGKSAADLRRLIDQTWAAAPDLVRAAIAGDLGVVRRRSRDGADQTSAYCLAHALKHTAEHVGQIELTRQLVARA